MKPRIVQNILAETLRYPTASIFGTGTTSATTEDDGINGLLQCSSGSAGRAWNSVTIALTANQWYCMSFEVIAASLGAVTDAGLKWTTAPNTGDVIINGTNITAGGVGRYATCFMDTVGGNFVYRIGVGIDGNVANADLTVKNLMLEKIDINVGGIPSEYVYQNYKAAFSRPNYTAITANHRVSESFGPAYTIEKGQVLLGFGDSRSDETDDMVGAISNALDRTGVCHIHAEGGWSTTNLVGPTLLKSQSLTSAAAIAGTLLHSTWSGDDNYEIYRLNSSGQAQPDVVVIANMGINDVAAGAMDNLTIDTAISNIDAITDEIIAAGKKPCITEITPWNAAAGFSAAAGDQIQTWVLNKRLKELAAAKDAIFVKLYKEFGDSTDANKLSDGSGSTPNYSDDALHINPAGCRVAAGLILCEIQLWKQMNRYGVARNIA